MADVYRQRQSFETLSDGDCSSDPSPALWHQDDDDVYAESGFIERFWLPMAIAVFAGWGSLSYFLYSAFGWGVIIAIVAVVAIAVTAGVLLVRTGDRSRQAQVEVAARSAVEQQESQYSRAA